MSEHKNNSQGSVEQNLAKDYVSNSKLSGLPMTSQINDAVSKNADKTKKNIDKFKDVILNKYKFAQCMGIIPAQASKIIEEEYEISENDAKKGLIHLLIVIPEKQFKNIGKIRLDLIEESKKIDSKFWLHVMTPVDFWNLGLDSKFDIMEAVSMSFPIFDKGFLGQVRVAQIHKSLVLKKFEKYVTSYVVGGSLPRGEAVKTSDVDVFIIIDDTDVKRMSRMELKEKLRGIIYSYIGEAEAISGVKNKLSPQVYLMTEFWEAVKDAHPVMFTFIRDGIPVYDRGTFLPWKSLLRMGKIRPSPEAIDMFMSSGNRLKETVQKRIFDIATLDLFWGVFTPTQGLLMLYGQAPKNHRDTVKAFRDTFVVKEKLIEEKYADFLDEIVIKIYKAMEHNKFKPGDIDGKKLDELSLKALDYIDRLKELRNRIDKRIQEKSIEKVYEDVFGMLGNLFDRKTESAIIGAFEKELVKTGKVSPRLLENLKFIFKTKKDVSVVVLKKGDLTSKQSRAVDEARKFSVEIIDVVGEYVQRCDLAIVDRSRFRIVGRDFEGEVFFLKNVFVVVNNKVQKIVGEKLASSNVDELKTQLEENKNKESKIDFNSLEVLKKAYGEFDLIQ